MKSLILGALALASHSIWNYCIDAKPVVYDGDSVGITAEIFPGLTRTFIVDLRGIDAPNIGPVGGSDFRTAARCPLEQQKGQAAKAYLEQLISNNATGAMWDINIGKILAYGRYPGDVIVSKDGTLQGVAGLMVSAGHAQNWPDGTALTRPSWC